MNLSTHTILCRKKQTNTGRNTETIINLLFSSDSLAAMLTNYEMKKMKNKIITKKVRLIKNKNIIYKTKTILIDQKIQNKNIKIKTELSSSGGGGAIFLFLLLLCPFCTPDSSHQPSSLSTKSTSKPPPPPDASYPPDLYQQHKKTNKQKTRRLKQTEPASRGEVINTTNT